MVTQMNNTSDIITESIKAHINNIKVKDRVIVAIDGRCASGKTTVGTMLAELLCADIIHIDDYYLPMSERCENWKDIIAGNINILRLKSEVLANILKNKEYIYRAYSCFNGCYKEGVAVTPKSVTIIEGSYSLHPDLVKFYDLTVFMDVDSQTQLDRIKRRNGESKLSVFRNLWIPLEERYFSYYNIKENSDLYYKT